MKKLPDAMTNLEKQSDLHLHYFYMHLSEEPVYKILGYLSQLLIRCFFSTKKY